MKNKPILYTATWCNPCTKLKQRLENEGLIDDVNIIVIDEIVQELKANIGLRSIPTLKINCELITDINEIFDTIKENKYD